MARYIDTDEFEKRIKPYDTNDPVDKALYNFAHNKMLDTSTADVVERKRGKWIDGKCSNCGSTLLLECIETEYEISDMEKLMNYCSNCGSDNREETENAETIH